MTTDERSSQTSRRRRAVFARRRAAAGFAAVTSAVVASALVTSAVVVAGPAPLRAALPPSLQPENVTHSPGPLVATDALGRELADYTEAPAPRDDRTVGVFYVLWHGSNDMREYKNIFDNNATLAEDPLAWQDPGSGKFPPPSHFAYWGKPLYGYFRSDDAWVVRRDLQMLADAQVDYLVLDTSNWEVYKPQAVLLMRTIVDLQSKGVRAPQVVFMTHTESARNMDEIYRTFYADDAPHRYPSTWFHWDGKPLIMGDSPSPAIREFFTFRHAQWPNEPQQPSDGWDWISFDRPQRGNHDADGNLEQMAVSPAQNSGSSAIFSYTAWYGLDERPSLSRSFHDGAEDETPGAENHGYNFQEQWDHAIAADPETMLILEWNEWIAGNWAASPNSPLVFYDVVNTRWSRDLAPMTGGYGDNYYLQVVDNIRRYKGVNPPATTSDKTTIDLDGAFDQWAGVSPEYADYAGDTEHRNHPGVDNQTYVNETGRNDIVSSKMARDDENVYVYAQTAEDLTPIQGSNWMTLYLGADADGTNGWHGFDYRVTFREGDDRSARLERASGDGGWEVVDDEVPFRAAGNELMVAVARDGLGLGADPLHVEFSWWDNQQDDSIMDAYVSGDAAPDGRFAYLYDTGEHPEATPLPGPPDVDAPADQDPGQYRIENDDRTTDYEAHLTPKASRWIEAVDAESSDGSYSYAYNPGGKPDSFFRTFIRAGFEGNSIRWVAPTGPQGTEAEVLVDGLSQGVVSQYSSQRRAQQVLFEARGLPAGQHEIMVVFEPQAGTYAHDYFEYGVGPAGLSGRGDTADVAATAHATSSSFAPAQWFATNAGQVNDGHLATYWRGTEQAGDHVELSFGRTAAFNRLEIVPRTAGSTVTSFEVQVHDRQGWRTVHHGGELAEASTIELGPTHADGLRLVVTGTTGEAPEIAEISVYQQRETPERASGTAWEFTNDTQGWAGDGPLDAVEWSEDETIGGTVAGEGAALLSPDGLDVPASEFPSVLLGLRTDTEARTGHLRYVATNEDGETVTGRQPFRLTGGGSFTDYVVDMTDTPGWAGTIRQIGVEVPAGEGRVELRHVRLAPDHAVYAAHFRTSEHGWTGDGSEVRWDRDTVTFPVDGDGDTLTSPSDLRADITNADTVTVRLRNASSATTGTLSFTTAADPDFAAARSASIDLVAQDSEVRTYQVDMSGVPGWQGLLTGLRIELTGATPGEEVSLDVVRVEPFVLTELNTVRSWDFEESAEGWGNAGAIADFGWSDGGVGGTIVGPDPQFYSSPSLWLDISELTTASVRMAVETDATFGTLYFTTEDSPNFSEANSVRIPLEPGETGYVDYELDMSGVPGWTGVLRQLRLDPEEGDSTGRFHVDRIELG